MEPLGEKVERLAALHATGALRCESGAVYLEAGIVVHAESELATGLDTLLTRCGRIPPDAWRASLSAFGREHRVGRMLVEQGQLTQGELELCHLGALHDAAFFTLGARSPAASFEPGVRHWLGPVSRVSARLLRRETVRRRDLLERIWPCPQLDSAPVVPALSATGCRSRTTPRQRELLRHADGRRTPADLARLLGRSAFSTTVEVRRLAALGVVATPPTEPPTEPLHESAAVPLQRRTPGAALRRRADSPDPQRAAAHPLFADNPDIALLTRVRNALEARL
ncbi:transcriptional regulator [Kitasatospora sp. MAP12-9]|uniref:transcriptional regulator n=1 Tax=Kitasatospora sp. MAP12-9 TaxID=3035100 RepID=UPI003D22826D